MQVTYLRPTSSWLFSKQVGRIEMEGNVVETATTYQPYGQVLEQRGTSGTMYGFTGEQEDGTTGLLYLRARYYSPQRKVFQSRDPWEGSGWRPGTLNRYTYVGGDPIRFSDPFGLCRTDDPYDQYADTECLEIAAYLARKEPERGFNYFAQFNAIALINYRDQLLLGEAQVEGIESIIEFFRVDGAGSADARLESLLRATSGFGGQWLPLNIQSQFGVQIPGGNLCDELQDERYYDGYEEWGTSYQTSHFLTAVSMTYYNLDPGGPPLSTRAYAGFRPSDLVGRIDQMKVALRLIIGHELVSDQALPPPAVWVAQYRAVTDSDIADFIDALAADLDSNLARRNNLLQGIVDLAPGDADRQRVGNSFEDLLLSLKGVEFGGLIQMGTLTTSRDAAVWLRTNLQ